MTRTLDRLPLVLCTLCLACASSQSPAASSTSPAAPEPPPAPAVEPAPAPPAPPAPPAAVVAPAAPAPKVAFSVEAGLSTPESVAFDAKRDVYLVSNINGGPLDVDDNGYITKLGTSGQVLAEKWIDGKAGAFKLNAPKGMVIVGDVLYVADIDHVRWFDAESGKPKGQVAIKGASFLNDLAADADGNVYVADTGMKVGKAGFEPTGTDAIHRVTPKKKVEKVVAKPELGAPNGLKLKDGLLWVVTFGSGALYSVDPKDGTQGTPQVIEGGQLDGLELTTDGRVLVSSWGRKAVLAGQPGGTLTPLIADVEAPADIGYDPGRNRVLVPLFTTNKVVAYDL